MSAAFIVRLSRPPFGLPELRDCYLRWNFGQFIPLPDQNEATRYDMPHSARAVASRMEQAYPGAHCHVEAVIQ